MFKKKVIDLCRKIILTVESIIKYDKKKENLSLLKYVNNNYSFLRERVILLSFCDQHSTYQIIRFNIRETAYYQT